MVSYQGEIFDADNHYDEAHDAFTRHGRKRTSPVNYMKRVVAVDLADDPVQIASSFVVGLKQLPIRYRLSEAG